MTVEFGDAIDPSLSDWVMALDAVLRSADLPVRDMIPTYRSLLIEYDAAIIDYAQMVESVLSCCTALPAVSAPGRTGKFQSSMADSSGRI